MWFCHRSARACKSKEHHLVKFKDYYEILGIDRKASADEVKAAYRKLARKYHPDANKNDPKAEEKIKELNEAYEVLKDPEKRSRYDQLGANWKAGDNFKPPPDFSGFSFDFGNLGDIGANKSFSDFFDMLFGQTFGSPQQQKAQGAQTRRHMLDQEADIELTVEELARGTRRTLQLSAPGGKPRTLEVKIPSGLRPGKKVRIPGEGATASGTNTKGDLYLRIKVKPHAYFTIDGDNLVCEIAISPAQAVIGSEALVNTIEGQVKIRIPAGTQNGRMLRLKGKGLPGRDGGAAGDQLVRTKVVVPSQISERERELYSELARIEKTPTA